MRAESKKKSRGIKKTVMLSDERNFASLTVAHEQSYSAKWLKKNKVESKPSRMRIKLRSITEGISVRCASHVNSHHKVVVLPVT